jgi:hypothetical protein
MDLYPWIVLVHIIAAFVFVLAHGVSAFVAFRIRGETDRTRIAALLDLSGGSLMTAFIALLVILVCGIWAAIAGGHFGGGKYWAWAALVVFLMTASLMTPLASGWLNRVRRAVGMPIQADRKAGRDPLPASDAELAAVLAAGRPDLVAAVGMVGLVVLVTLMRFKPF